MHFLIFVLIICFFIFLFSLYFLANDDMVIIRKDMPMEKIFNTAFLTVLVALLFSRVFYVIFNPQNIFLNPLGFLLFPYFPGLSLLGGLLGGMLFLSLYSNNQRLPLGKTFDFFALSFLSTLPVGFLGVFILSGKSYFLKFIFAFITYSITYFVFAKILLPLSFSGKIKNGSLSIIFVVCFSVISFFLLMLSGFKNFNIFSLENLTLLILFISSSVFLLKQEVIGKRVKK